MQPSDPLHTLATFRHYFYECLHPWADALFELTDALLSADGVPSPVHLSPKVRIAAAGAAFMQRSGEDGSTLKTLRELLARHPLAGCESTPFYAVDVSVWDRCDAESSPKRGFYYHPSRHSAGQRTVAGWAYQFIARLIFIRES
jgi:hypothetical protein